MEIRIVQPSGAVWVMESPTWCVSVSMNQLTRLLSVSAATVRRWAAESSIPRSAELALRHNVLGLIDKPGWEGFSIDGLGKMYTPSQFEITAGQVANYQNLVITLNDLAETLKNTPRGPSRLRRLPV